MNGVVAMLDELCTRGEINLRSLGADEAPVFLGVLDERRCASAELSLAVFSNDRPNSLEIVPTVGLFDESQRFQILGGIAYGAGAEIQGLGQRMDARPLVGVMLRKKSIRYSVRVSSVSPSMMSSTSRQ